MKRGQRVSAEIEAARLGVDRGIPDLHLAIYDADGKKLAAADDSALFVQDPVLSVLADRDGAYFVEVRHSMYNGANDVYRLHVGTFTRPTAIYPAGGQAGERTEGPHPRRPAGRRGTRRVRLPATPGDFPFVAVDPTACSAPSPNRLRVSPFPNVLEAEPNDTPEAVVRDRRRRCRSRSTASSTSRATSIASASGRRRASSSSSTRWPTPSARRSTRSSGSSRSAARRTPRRSGRPTRGRTSSASRPRGGLNRETHDPVLEFTAPADGEYVLGVEDERGEGGSDYVYRVEVRPEENAVYTYIAPEPENQYQPQLRQAIAVAAGQPLHGAGRRSSPPTGRSTASWSWSA